MPARTAIRYLFIATLLLCQWVGFAHAAEHPAFDDGTHVCQICLHQQGIDHATPPARIAAPDFIAGIEIASAPLPTACGATTQRTHPIRAPPVLA